MRRALVLMVLTLVIALVLPALAQASEQGAVDQSGTTMASVPSAPPPVTGPVEEQHQPPEGDAMWWLLGISAVTAIVLLLVHVWSSDRPEEMEGETRVRRAKTTS